MKLKLTLTAVAAMAAASLPVLAHHSFAAEYDSSKPVTIKGKFVKMDWVNPHSWIYVEVTGSDGKVAQWKAEALPPNGLYRQGWRRDSIKAGEDVFARDADWHQALAPDITKDKILQTV